MKNYLNFENDIKDLENELDKLKDPYNQGGLSEVDTDRISKTQDELDQKLKEILPLESMPELGTLTQRNFHDL